jgi:hypothetical protein
VQQHEIISLAAKAGLEETVDGKRLLNAPSRGT